MLKALALMRNPSANAHSSSEVRTINTRGPPPRLASHLPRQAPPRPSSRVSLPCGARLSAEPRGVILYTSSSASSSRERIGIRLLESF